jgi:hypothetical protein
MAGGGGGGGDVGEVAGGGGGGGGDDASAGDLRVTGDPDAPGPLFPRPSCFRRSDALTGKKPGKPMGSKSVGVSGIRHKPISFQPRDQARVSWSSDPGPPCLIAVMTVGFTHKEKNNSSSNSSS